MTFIGWLSTLEKFIEIARLAKVSSLARSLALSDSNQNPEQTPFTCKHYLVDRKEKVRECVSEVQGNLEQQR